jgi:14-3-3 protein epsilon
MADTYNINDTELRNTLDMANLDIDDEDDELELEIVDDQPQVNRQQFLLIGRFLTNRPIRVKTMINKMGDIWQPGKGMDIEEVYPGLFIFKFYHQLDVQHILKQGPWSFDNHTLVLNTISDDEDPREVPLFNVPFWIQVHNLPGGYMSQKTGKSIRDYIGEFLEYDDKNDSLSWRKYMRIRVLIDVRKPLKRQKKIKKQGADSRMVQFKYERLGTFCYVCGILGHSDSKCPKLFEATDNDIGREWGPELRADMGRNRGSESRWLRQSGDQEWVAPNPVMMSNNGSSSKSGGNNEEINASNEVSTTKPKLAEIFREPEKIFPKTAAANKNRVNVEIMEEDDMDDLIIEGDRKRSRGTGDNENMHKQNLQAHEEKEKHTDTETTKKHSPHFLLAGPGGARQGQ